MENGLIVRSPYAFHPLQTRADLRSPEMQALLKAHHKRPHSIGCACCGDLGMEPDVVVKQIGYQYCLAREDISGHHVGCFLRRAGDEFAGEVIRTSALFLEDTPPPPSSRANEPASWDAAQRRFDDWASYARRLLSVGATEAWLATNRMAVACGRELGMPRMDVLLRCIDSAVRQLEFRDAENGYAAAEMVGVRLRFGLLLDPPAMLVNFPLPLSVGWWDGDHFRHGLAVFPPHALHPALADLSVHGHVQGPPYLVVAAVEPNGTVRRALLHQVFLDGSYLVFIDSGYEGRHARKFLLDGDAFLKPIREDEIHRVLKALGIDSLASDWRYRPDFFRIQRSGESWSFEAIEVRGFLPGKNPVYDARLAYKLSHYRRLLRGTSGAVRCLDGWEPPPVPILQPRQVFRGVPNCFEPAPQDIYRLAGS